MRPRSVYPAPGIKSVDKALRVLERLGESRREMGVHELARHLNLDVTTIYRILRSLESRGFVQHNAESGRYRLGLRLLQLGEAFLETIELRAVARPHLQRLSEETEETAHLMVLDGCMGTYLDRVESPQRVRVASNVGRREHLHCSAVGKAILAFLPEERVREIVETVGLPRFTPRTITSLDFLLAHLEEVRGQGYAIDDAEGEEGVRCVGAPVFDARGEVIGSLSISAPLYRTSLERLHGWSPLVITAAWEISRSLGYGGDHLPVSTPPNLLATPAPSARQREAR
jgi:DNA-binding IclR family transcriptional regulator